MELRLAKLTLCAAMMAGALFTSQAQAAQCGNNSSGFERWKSQFAAEAKANGVGNRGLKALAGTSYATKTIHADRNQKSFKYSLQKFMQIRGANSIVSVGRQKKKANAKFFARLEAKYGVPAGPLLAIHGMETGFGRFMGNSNVVSAIATLAYDCRRSDFFTGHLYAALQLVDRGVISSNTKGAMHGEVGHTQFLPGSVLKYGVDGDGNGRVDLAGSQYDALASTANFLRAHGWKRGAGYQPGQTNFRAIQGWNAAGVYQQAIAIMAAKIDQ
ncbi:lytic transglycosylase domain-containing protein [Oricola sp.]|uniref:lytic murein transglycosylase n=1 Tax=Oricola sp. TaxID=1979950 RepID=UPI0025E0F532|nr:lytic transglycosylase domain-containing protein [Oricola sp.]MCI5077511.1 lytic transglycosylase domain-containing protein [Oricola sp.]